MRAALRTSIFTSLLVTTLTSQAQTDRFSYAITDITKDGASWNALRKLDLQTGQYSDILFNGSDAKTIAYDAATRKAVEQKSDPKWGTSLNNPFSTGVAALAYDRRHNRLYYTPMFIDQLRYIDLSNMKVYYVTDKAFSGLGTMHGDEGKIVTRMVINPDGTGYAITNDANTFVQFTTDKNPKVTALGSLVDDPSNGAVSVHNRCSSFGGDMIADDRGNLYILTARNNVFQVNIETKTAKLLGNIQGLSQNFTVNGAAVDGDGNILVSSAVDGTSYYTVSPKDWTATPYKASAGIFRSSDLANSNYLSTNRNATTEIATIKQPISKYSNLVQVYPNPVTNNRFTLEFNKIPSGSYTIEVNDVTGTRVAQRALSINSENQLQSMSLPGASSKGIYLVRVLDNNKRAVYEQKIMVQ
jgi:hypothetical protein